MDRAPIERIALGMYELVKERRGEERREGRGGKYTPGVICFGVDRAPIERIVLGVYIGGVGAGRGG